MPSAVKAFYEATGGDYADAVARFSSEARLIRFLRKFPADDSFRSLSACLQTNDTAGAIFALHSLNGVSALLGFCRLSDTCALLSRALKFGSPDAAAELLPAFKRNTTSSFPLFPACRTRNIFDYTHISATDTLPKGFLRRRLRLCAADQY